MTLWDSLLTAFRALTVNRLRSALTLLGIVIGVGAVIALMSIGRGARQTVTEQIQGIGSNLLFVTPGQATVGRVAGAATLASLTTEDAEALADLPSVQAAVPRVSFFGQIVNGPLNARGQIVGTLPQYLEVRNLQMASGSFLGEEHALTGAMVAVLGANIAAQLFPDDDPIGKTVYINRRPFRVLGVLAPRGGTGFTIEDDTVVVPLKTAVQRLQVRRSTRGGIAVDLIYVQARSDALMEQARQEVSEALLARFQGNAEAFTIVSQQDVLNALTQITNAFTLFLGAIAGISLLVGGIGIMNIMLVSVTERTREIGIRKAVGARRRDILLQFLFESAALGLMGGIMGTGLGYGLARLMERFSIGGQNLRAYVAPDVVFLAVGVSLAVGLFFGLYPARRAAGLDPIQALRYE
ncbi:MAG: ABC transporter permease [Dehalococcoidia bacterium]|nr:ABC transporter permease [Dehalococcoidia bacterium]MDW8119344.1 ABC transporter permease [Chloroflexota bacterium]